MKLRSAILAAAIVGVLMTVGFAMAASHDAAAVHTTASAATAAIRQCSDAHTTPVRINGKVVCELHDAKAHCPAGRVLVMLHGKSMCASGHAELIPGVPVWHEDSNADAPGDADASSSHGTPYCHAGYTLVSLNGEPMCKGATTPVCDKHELRKLIPVAAFGERWDPQACVWHYRMAN